MAEFNTEGTRTYQNLIAGEFPRVEKVETLLSGAGDLSAGAVLAQDSGNSNKLVLVDNASATSSIQSPYAILAEDVDASAADAEAVVYLSGHFNEDVLTFGGDDTIADHRAALRQLGIYTGSNLGA